MKLLYLSFLTVLTLAGCASFINQPTAKIAVNSVPNKAFFTVKNKAGEKVYTGITPKQIELKRSAGYLEGERYSVSYSKDGYNTQQAIIESQISPWYYGNLVNVLGLFGVDPMTGAMWDLTESVDVNLHKK